MRGTLKKKILNSDTFIYSFIFQFFYIKTFKKPLKGGHISPPYFLYQSSLFCSSILSEKCQKSPSDQHYILKKIITISSHFKQYSLSYTCCKYRIFLGKFQLKFFKNFCEKRNFIRNFNKIFILRNFSSKFSWEFSCYGNNYSFFKFKNFQININLFTLSVQLKSNINFVSIPKQIILISLSNSNPNNSLKSQFYNYQNSKESKFENKHKYYP